MKKIITSSKGVKHEVKVLTCLFQNQHFNFEVPKDASFTIKQFTNYYSKNHLNNVKINVINPITNKFANYGKNIFDYYKDNNNTPLKVVTEDYTEQSLIDRGITSFPFKLGEYSTIFQSILERETSDKTLINSELSVNPQELVKNRTSYANPNSDIFSNKVLLSNLLLNLNDPDRKMFLDINLKLAIDDDLFKITHKSSSEIKNLFNRLDKGLFGLKTKTNLFSVLSSNKKSNSHLEDNSRGELIDAVLTGYNQLRLYPELMKNKKKIYFGLVTNLDKCRFIYFRVPKSRLEVETINTFGVSATYPLGLGKHPEMYSEDNVRKILTIIKYLTGENQSGIMSRLDSPTPLSKEKKERIVKADKVNKEGKEGDQNTSTINQEKVKM